jgi:hypothetical protein
VAKAPVEIRSLARSHTEKALATLAEIMCEPTAPHSARVSAASALLDRGWGKPDQRLEAEHVHRYVARLPEKANSTDTWQQKHAPPSLQ